jgi:type I restriction enzyme S subunit
MRWEKVKLGDLANCIQPGPFGSQLHSSDYADEGTPIIMPKDMIGGKISHQDLIRVPDEHLQRLKRHQVFDGDLMVARKGDVRKCVYITENENGWLTGSDCLKVSLDKGKCYPKYIYYQLRSPFIGRWLETISIGATMPSLNTGLLSGIEISLPTIDEQMRIAEVLSSYDDLIENNQKQIKLLEEAAQRLYKEWFVDLRFPGHETTPITDGIPEGWTEGTLVDLAVFKRGKTITKGQVNEGNVPVVAGGLEPAYYHDTPNTDAPVITVSGSGANAGFTRMYYTKVWASDCSYIDVSVTHDIAWIYCFLKENKASIDSMQKGAAQPHVYAKDLNAMKVVVPCDSLMEQFRTAAEPMFSKIGKLEMQIKMLTEARDRLLPKLMNGEIEV